MNRLQGKTAIITGGAGGIGIAAGKLFAEQGASVLLAGRNEGSLASACRKIDSERVSYLVSDITRASDNQAMVAAAVERYGGLDILVANAAIEGAIAPIVEYGETQFEEVLEVNVKGTFLGLQAAIPAMEKRGGGSIVITSSVGAVRGLPNFCAYNVAKHALTGLMRCAALECADKKIRVNSVNPSQVETDMARRIEESAAPGAGDELRRELAKAIPLGRYATPEDIARLMLFLASDDSAFITGSMQMIDGGLST
ncbi:MAG: SDR family NAD(P)-dependent oxidoreductase [Parahaliea sp.]